MTLNEAQFEALERYRTKLLCNNRFIGVICVINIANMVTSVMWVVGLVQDVRLVFNKY